MSGGAYGKGKTTMFPNSNLSGVPWTYEIGKYPTGQESVYDYSNDTSKRNQTDSIAHPIFANVTIYDKPGILDNPDRPVKEWYQVWNSNEGTNFKTISSPLDDEIATNCVLDSGSIDTYNINCWTHGNFDKPNKDDALISRTNWDIYCQMGDNALTDSTCVKTKTVYNDFTKPSVSTRNFAMERICNKIPGELINKTRKATTESPPITNPLCQEWCEETDFETGNFIHNCKKGGNNYCGNVENWPAGAEFCKNVIWAKEFDSDSANSSCKNLLIDIDSDQNIFTNTGCGTLCQSKGIPEDQHKDVNYNWCNTKYGEFCSNEDNMFTDNCYDFCKNQPQYCEPKLKSVCSPESVIGRIPTPEEPLTDEEFTLIQTKMSSYIPGTSRKWADWCGCYQDSQFYDKWKAKEYKKWLDHGIDPEIALGNINIECTYPYCKPSIKTYTQDQTECPQCTQLRFDDWSDAVLNNSVVDTGQELGCGQVAQQIQEQLNSGSSEETSTNESETTYHQEEPGSQINVFGALLAGDPNEWSNNIDPTTKEGQMKIGVIILVILLAIFGLLMIFGFYKLIKHLKNKNKKSTN